MLILCNNDMKLEVFEAPQQCTFNVKDRKYNKQRDRMISTVYSHFQSES